jgi:hypothetical protein
MENLLIEGTKTTPKIHLDYQKGYLEFSGRSIVDNPWEYYLPILEWVDKYAGNPPSNHTTVVFNFEYYNTGSSKSILEILRILETLPLKGHTVKCTWYEINEEPDDILSFIETLDTEIVFLNS